MFGLGKIRLHGVDKKVITDEAHADDFKAAPAIGRVRFGKLCFYYRDLGRKYYVPYDYIERAFIRISETQPDNKEKEADDALAKLQDCAPNMAVGYVPPPGGKKPSFR